ncbi:Two component regulator propeller [Granulicella rosea]|uniref:Two component regulator propeller n=1 Tax=Granulicella rosea TaxID=474952 RepID=A0A239JY03_9BACT|nr:sensor histidine kinase [Granulicella rosea]SNT10382.1 Two component regulator propeller [Granulicella rosea]
MLALVLMFPCLCLGQGESFSISTWGTHDGLPEMSVQGLAIEPRGGLYVGTSGGLCLFDGTYCKPLQNREMSKFPASNLTALFRARDQSVWVGTVGGGLLHITSDRVEVFDRRSGLEDPYVRAIFEDSRGHLWVGTEDGLFRRSGAAFQKIELPQDLGRQEVYALAEDAQKRLVVGGNELVYLDESESATPVSTEARVPFPLRSLLSTKDGRLLLGTLGGLFERSGETFNRLPIPHGDVEALCESADGAIWAGTIANGLWRLQRGKALQVLIGDDQPGHSILAMSADANGRLWIGTESGLSRIEPTDVHVIPSPVASVDRETLSISPRGTVLLVNSQVYRLDSAMPKVVPLPLPGNPKILNLLYASDRSVWVGTAGNGVFRLDSEGHTTQYASWARLKIAGNFPRGIAEGVNGDIWVASGFGLNRITAAGINQFDSLNGLPNRNVRTLHRDRNGCMWVGTDGGPAVYCGGHFVENRATQSLRGEEIWAMTEDANGTMWLGTRNHGIYAYREPELHHFSISDGLLSNFTCGLVADRNGTLWISSPEGLSSISIDQSLSESKNTDLVFARPHPLPRGAENLKFNAGRFPNAVVDDRGIVWFATSSGPVYVDPSQPTLTHAWDGPVPVITSVLADEAYLQRVSSVRVPPRSKLLTFTFGATYLGSEQDMLLAYRLRGADDKWASSAGAHQVEYRALPPGTYTFELRAYSRAQPDTWKDAHVSFVVPVVWYRSIWFYLLILPCVAAASLLLYMLHLQQIKGRFKLILEERTRLAREMHDTLIQGCNGVAMLLEAEASSRGLPGSSYLDIAREQLQATVADAREAVWNLRQTELESDLIIAALKNISTQASESFGIPVTVHHAAKLPKLPADAAHEILMIVREAVTNAGSHGHPRAIRIDAQHSEDYLSFRVCDDGVGFGVDAASAMGDDHYGILGMHERAAMIGANLEITSTPGAGACILLTLKMKS